MVWLIRRAALKNSLMVSSFTELMKIAVPEIPRIEHGMDFESMTTRTRHEILQATWSLLNASHSELENALSLSSMSKQAFLSQGQTISPTLKALVDTLPDHSFSRQPTIAASSKGPQPKRSVIANMAALERRLNKRRQ